MVTQPWKQAAEVKDYQETIGFLEQLRPNGPWLLTAIIPDGQTETITAFDHEQVLQFVRKNDKRKNLYFSVNAVRKPLNHKASKFDIARIEYVLADLDPRHDESPDDAKSRYLALLVPHEPAATAIIDSGNGLQALWRLAEPIVLDDVIVHDNKKAFTDKDAKIIADVEARSASLMARLGSVAGTQNIDRILRLPGTTNIPNKKKLEAGRTACPTKLIRFNDSRCLLEEFPRPDPHAQQSNGQAHTSAADLFKKLPAALKKAIASAPYDGEDTSETSASVITQLCMRNLLDSEIISLFDAFPRGIGKRYVEGKDLKADVLRLRAKYASDADTATKKTSVIVRVSDIPMRAKRWLWRGHLLCGALELLTGTPGLGKSQVQISFIASATGNKPWPDGTLPEHPPMNVIMLTAEDTIAEEVRPRLVAAGANCDMVYVFNKIRKDGKDRQFLLAEDLDEIEKHAIEIGNVGLITIDPITAYMGGKVDSYKATEVRSQLGPLKDFAERTGVALSAITHPAKQSSAKAIDQFIGSQAFVAACRIGHVCAPEVVTNEDEERVTTGRVYFTHAKHNASKKKDSLAYSIEEVFVAHDPENQEAIQSPRVVWADGPVDISADEAVAASNSTAAVKAKDVQLKKIMNMLNELLRNGEMPITQIEERAKELGFDERKLRTAKEKLGIQSFKKDNVWYWRLLL